MNQKQQMQNGHNLISHSGLRAIYIMWVHTNLHVILSQQAREIFLSIQDSHLPHHK
jgi:hypothetical protein